MFLMLPLMVSCGDESTSKLAEEEVVEPSISELFKQLNRSSRWMAQSAEPLLFATWHTQGMTKLNGVWFLSTVEIQERTTPLPAEERYDRTAGKGAGHLIAFNEDGEKLWQTELGEGDLYHPGGIDRDERYIWVPVAEYRPDSHSIIYRVDPASMDVEELFRFPDHIGAVIRDSEQNRLIGYSWGSRRIYVWDLDEKGKLLGPEAAEKPEPLANPQHYIDYQDCQFVGGGKALCSGLANYVGPQGIRYPLGGIHLIELETFRPLWQIPVEQFTEGNPPRVMTQNPFFAEIGEWGLRFHFIPEDDQSFHYIFRVSPAL